MCASMVLPLVFMAIVAMILVAKSVVVVPPGQVYVVGTLGKANRVLQAGLHILPPFVTAIVGRVPVSEQTLDVAETGGRMKDGQTAAVSGTVRYTVTEPLLAINDVDDYQRATAQLTATHWRAAIEASDGAHLRAALERQARVLAWLAEREEEPADSGHPSAEQERAFTRWMQEAVEEHREEIEAALRDRHAPAVTNDPFVPPGADADAAFRGAAPGAIAFAVARSPIPPVGTGRVEAGGREWAARNESTVAIVAGFRCVVERQDGDSLIVRPL